MSQHLFQTLIDSCEPDNKQVPSELKHRVLKGKVYTVNKNLVCLWNVISNYLNSIFLNSRLWHSIYVLKYMCTAVHTCTCKNPVNLYFSLKKVKKIMRCTQYSFLKEGANLTSDLWPGSVTDDTQVDSTGFRVTEYNWTVLFWSNKIICEKYNRNKSRSAELWTYNHLNMLFKNLPTQEKLPQHRAKHMQYYILQIIKKLGKIPLILQQFYHSTSQRICNDNINKTIKKNTRADLLCLYRYVLKFLTWF